MKRQLLKNLCMAFLVVIGMSSIVKAQNSHWMAEISAYGAISGGQLLGNHLAIDDSGNTYTASSYAGGGAGKRWTGAFNSENKAKGTDGAENLQITTNATGTTNYYNGLVAKTNAAGQFQWMLGFGNDATANTTEFTTGLGTIAVSDIPGAEGVYVGGIFKQNINFVSGTPSGLTAIPAIIKTGTAGSTQQDGLVIKLTQDGSYQWYKVFGGTGIQAVTGLATDNVGNLIVIGTYTNTLSITGTITTITAVSTTDAFVAKFDKDGTLLFLKSIGGGTGAETIWGVATDIDNAIYIAGNTASNSNEFKIDQTVLDLSSASGSNSYLAKLMYDSDANDYVCVWAKAILSTQTQLATAIVVDKAVDVANRNIYLTGTASAIGTGDGKINFAGYEVTANNTDTSPFAAKFSANTGEGVWAKVFNVEGTCNTYTIAMNDNQEIFLGGYYTISLAAAEGGTLNGVSSGGNGYVLKLNSNGTVLDTKNIAYSGQSRIMGLAVTNTAVYMNGISGGDNGQNGLTENFAGISGADFYYRTGSYDGFIIKWNSTTLPVSLTGFKGNKTSLGNLLSWETLSEKNNKYFEVERSTDGVNFSAIERIAGAGTSTEKLSYNYLDANPVIGVNYYRLKQVDIDEVFSYSKEIIVVNNQLELEKVKLYPNPGKGIIKVQLAHLGMNINVYNQFGMLIRTYKNISDNDFIVDITDQTIGVYFIQIIDNERSQIVKYIKN